MIELSIIDVILGAFFACIGWAIALEIYEFIKDWLYKRGG